MTAGNVSSAMNATAGLLMQSNAISSGIDTGNNFQSIMQMTSNKHTVTEYKPVEASVQNNKTRETVVKDSKEPGLPKDKMEEFAKEIKDVVKDALGLSDTELETKMAELGITVLDLLNPQVLVKLISSVENVSPMTIVTDEDLSELLSTMTNKITETVNLFAMENQISPEELTDEFSKFIKENELVQTEVPDENTDVTIQPETLTVVTDSETGEKIEISIKDNRTESEVVKTGENPEIEITETKEPQNDSDADAGTDNAQNFMQNLTDAVAQSMETTSDVNNVQYVDGADIIRQVIDSIRINATSEVQSIEIQLTPESLGKINLSVVAKDGIITASITAQNETVKNAIESQLVQLKEQLNNQGLKVESVEVTVASRGFENSMDKNDGTDENNTKSNARRKFRGIDELTDEESPEEIIELTGMDSSINLRA